MNNISVFSERKSVDLINKFYSMLPNIYLRPAKKIILQ